MAEIAGWSVGSVVGAVCCGLFALVFLWTIFGGFRIVNQVDRGIVFRFGRDLGKPVAQYVADNYAGRHVFVLIAEFEPDRWWARTLRNNRGNVLDRALRKQANAVVCRMRFPVPSA